MGQKIGRYISIVILVLSSALGVWNGLSDWEIDRTALQASVTVGVLLHSLVGFGAAATLIRKAPAFIGLAINWCARVVTQEPNVAVGQRAEVAG